MPINRRTALKQAFIVAGGTIFLPACLHHKDKSSLVLHHIQLDGDQQEALEALADTLLPAGSSPSDQTQGAKAVGAHLFALKMIDDCYPDNQQQQFMRGLNAFNQQARQQYGKPFAGCDPSQQAALVSAIDTATSAGASANASTTGQKTNDLSFFFHENKDLVIRGYLGSKYFLTKIEVYELVPGRWHGCTPVIKKT
jgi:hypothetical protein